MTLFFVLGGLLFLALVLASIAQRYQDYVEERRRRVESILRRVGEALDGGQALLPRARPRRDRGGG